MCCSYRVLLFRIMYGCSDCLIRLYTRNNAGTNRFYDREKTRDLHNIVRTFVRNVDDRYYCVLRLRRIGIFSTRFVPRIRVIRILNHFTVGFNGRIK